MRPHWGAAVSTGSSYSAFWPGAEWQDSWQEWRRVPLVQNSYHRFHASQTPGKGLRSLFRQCLGYQAQISASFLGLVHTLGAGPSPAMLHARRVELSRLHISTLATVTDTNTHLVTSVLIIIISLTGLVLPTPAKTPKLWLEQRSFGPAPPTATRISSQQKAPPWTEDILFESIAQSAISDEYSGSDGGSQVTRSNQLPNHDSGLRQNPSYDQLLTPSDKSLQGFRGSRKKSEADKFTERSEFSDQGHNHANSFGFNKATNPSFPFGILFQSKDLSVEASKLSYLQKRSAAVPNSNKSARIDSFDVSSQSDLFQVSPQPNHAQDDEYYPELTSDSDSRSISNYSLLSQCLSSKNCNCNQLSQHNLTNNASVAAIEICSNASKLRLRLTLFHPDHRSVCWSSGPKNCPPPVLTQGQVSNIKSDDPDTCRAQVDKILCQIQEFNIHIENTLNVLQSGHGMDECSVNSTCQTCKDWYKSWLCLNFWPIYYLDGRVLPPCPNQCTTVQTSCPFHTIFEDASMASGDPTFLCQDSAISSKSQSSTHQSCCFEVQLQIPNYLHGDPGSDEIPAPREGEYVDLNTTHSCSNLLPLGTTTQLCDSAHIELANRTLLVKRRGAKSLTSDSGWLDLIGLTSGSTPCPLQSVAGAAIFIWTYSYKFYTL